MNSLTSRFYIFPSSSSIQTKDNRYSIFS